MTNKELIKEVLRLVELRVLMPYEGAMTNGNDCCQELHRKILDNQREWFNKLQNELKDRK